MTASIPFNPTQTTNALGSFGVDWSGFIAGTAYADPSARYRLAGGLVASTETYPMWGGLAISEATPNTVYSQSSPAPISVLGTIISRATAIGSLGVAGSLTGFSVFDQNYAMINTPQSPVPLAASLMQVNFYRLGSNARIALPYNPALSLNGNIITQSLSWDFVNQQLTPYLAAWASEAITSATYTSSTGIIALTFGTAPFGASIGSGANGVYINLSGLTTSAGAASAVNGTFPVTGTGSSGTVVSVQGAIGLGTITINGSTGTLAAGGGVAPVKVLDYDAGHSMVVVYNIATGAATWNRSGYAALVQI